jgi:hypothetical protein
MKSNDDYSSHPDSRATYRSFANLHGIHFDDSGNVFKVETAAPLAKGTFMTRESLDKLFAKSAKTPLDSWAGLYEGVVNRHSPEWTLTSGEFGLLLPRAGVTVGAAPDQHGSSPWEPPKPPPPPQPPAPPRSPTVIVPPYGIGLSGMWPSFGIVVGDKPPAKKEEEKPAPAAPPVEAAPQPTANGKTFSQLAGEKAFAGYALMQKLEITRPVTFADIAADPAYPKYAAKMEDLVARLQRLPGELTSSAKTRFDKERLIDSFCNFSFTLPLGEGKLALARHEYNATILVGLLRAGAELYKDQFGAGKKFTPEGLQLVSAVGKACVMFAETRMGVEAAEAAKIADIIQRGADPSGPALPLEKLLAQFPAPPLPPQAPAATKKSSGRRGPGF